MGIGLWRCFRVAVREILGYCRYIVLCGHSVDQFNPNVSACAAHTGVVSIIVLNVFYDTMVILITPDISKTLVSPKETSESIKALRL